MANANNSEKTTILKENVYDSLGAAIIELNTTRLIEGNTITLRYYTDDTKQRVDSLFAVVINSGVGNSCYKIISDHGLVVVHDFLKGSLPDVSRLLSGEYYIYTHNDGINYFVFLWGNVRKTVKIIDPCIVSCLGERNPNLGIGNPENKGLYQVTTKSIRNLLDCYTRSEVNDLLTGLTNRVIKLETDYTKLEKRVSTLETYHRDDSAFGIKSFRVDPSEEFIGNMVSEPELSWEYNIIDYTLVSQEIFISGQVESISIEDLSARSYKFLGRDFTETTEFRLEAKAVIIKNGVEQELSLDKTVTLEFKKASVSPEVRIYISGVDKDGNKASGSIVNETKEVDGDIDLTEELIKSGTVVKEISISNDAPNETLYNYTINCDREDTYIYFIFPIKLTEEKVIEILDGNGNPQSLYKTGISETTQDHITYSDGSKWVVYQTAWVISPATPVYQIKIKDK